MLKRSWEAIPAQAHHDKPVARRTTLGTESGNLRWAHLSGGSTETNISRARSDLPKRIPVAAPGKRLGRSSEGGGVHTLALDYLCTPLHGAMENRFGAQCSRRGTAAFGASETSDCTGQMAQVAPNVWTGCPSQLRACGRKSLICIRPVARLAGRGLDGNTHAPLISLRDRLLTSHQGHQIQGASIDPFHAGPQSRIRSRRSAKSPWPRGVYRRPCRSAGRSRRSGRACWLTRRRACFCATAPTPF